MFDDDELRPTKLHKAAPRGARVGHPWPPNCDRCGMQLTKPGALIFSPPNQHGECAKFHVCVGCHGALVTWVSNGKTQAES
jgi:hypothetical protein